MSNKNIGIEELTKGRTPSELLDWVESKLDQIGSADDGERALRLGEGLAKQLVEARYLHRQGRILLLPKMKPVGHRLVSHSLLASKADLHNWRSTSLYMAESATSKYTGRPRRPALGIQLLLPSSWKVLLKSTSHLRAAPPLRTLRPCEPLGFLCASPSRPPKLPGRRGVVNREPVA